MSFHDDTREARLYVELVKESTPTLASVLDAATRLPGWTVVSRTDDEGPLGIVVLQRRVGSLANPGKIVIVVSVLWNPDGTYQLSQSSVFVPG